MGVIIPKSNTDMAAMAVLVALAWQDKFPTFQVDFITATDLLQQAQAFTAKSRQNKTQDAVKKVNTVALRNLNRRIDKAVSILKRRIQLENIGLEDLSAIYESYGLEQPKEVRKPKPKAEAKKDASTSKDASTDKGAVIVPLVAPVAVPADAKKTEPKPKKKNFALPADNDRRVDTLIELTDKMSEVGDPYANGTYGLAYFQALQAEHQQLWSDSLSIKMGKSTFSRETRAYFKATEETLRSLVLAIRSKYRVDTNKVLREFGFLQEVF